MFLPFELSKTGEALYGAAQKIAAEVARPFAAEVDIDARFPHEAIQALKDARLLGAYVPVEHGGEGATPADIAAIAYALGQGCSNTAMVFAMHQIQVACLVHHGLGVDSLRSYAERVAAEQLVLASATTELGVGGDVRTSLCAADLTESEFFLRKEAPVISYADHADAIMVTARRSADAASSDQVIIVVDRADATLTQTLGWDTLGMRGTCSNGYLLEARGARERVLPEPYADISSRTMLPVTHIWWSSLWLGMATDAVNSARNHLRTLARKTAGDTPAIASDVALLFGELEMVSARISSALHLYSEAASCSAGFTNPGFVLRMNSLKTSASAAVIGIITRAMNIVGIAAYRNDADNSIARLLRDAHSTDLMVHNERILQNSGRLLCVYKGQ